MATGELPSARYVLLALSFPALIVVIVVGLIFAADAAKKARDLQFRESMRKQISDVKSGLQDFILASNESDSEGVQLDEFAKSKDTFLATDDFKLDIMYSQNVDAFLQRLAGIHGVTELYFHNTDVTDVGMIYVATFPHLKNVILERGGITDKGIAALRKCPMLEEVFIEPYQADAVSIPTLLSLPHLRKLEIRAPENSDWLRKNLHQLEQATHLQELTLTDGQLHSEDVERLQSHLPNCKITLNPN